MNASRHVSFLSRIVTVSPSISSVAKRRWTGAWRYLLNITEHLVGSISLAIPKGIRRHVIVLHDVTFAVISLPLAASLRFGTLDLPQQTFDALFILVPSFGILFLTVSLLCETHLGVWYHCSIHDFRILARAVTISQAILFGLAYRHWDNGALPWSLPIIQWLGLLAVLVGSRLAYRLLHGGGLETVLRAPATVRPDGSTIVIGSNDSAAWFLRALQAAPIGMNVVGIIDPDAVTVGRRILGVPILGRLDALPETIADFSATGTPITSAVLTGRPSIALMKRVLEQVGEARIVLYRVPDPLALADAGNVRLELQPIAIEDLLGRPQVKPDLEAMAALIQNAVVLVTGAGGSIGSELVRQIAGYGAGRMVLLDNCEFNLYQIDHQLGELFPNLSREVVLCDVRNRDQLMSVFRASSPDLVFHAAALKHVPMVELNPCEGMLTNAIGSRNVADAAWKCGARAMVQISTDKAVNPTSVMGASKRLAEFYCQALDSRQWTDSGPRCRFITVRFGNVLGSSGSVVPLFQQQLERGGPLTITHPDITRYFMTISEAVELILHASAYGIQDDATRGEIFVLDMGEPVRVVDLARQMIRIAGLVPDEDVAIEIIGLRPGEKLYEELFDSSEQRLPSRVPGVLAATSQLVNMDELSSALIDIERAARFRDEVAIRQAIDRFIPGYDAMAGRDMGASDGARCRTSPAQNAAAITGALAPPVSERVRAARPGRIAILSGAGP